MRKKNYNPFLCTTVLGKMEVLNTKTKAHSTMFRMMVWLWVCIATRFFLHEKCSLDISWTRFQKLTSRHIICVSDHVHMALYMQMKTPERGILREHLPVDAHTPVCMCTCILYQYTCTHVYNAKPSATLVCMCMCVRACMCMREPVRSSA